MDRSLEYDKYIHARIINIQDVKNQRASVNNMTFQRIKWTDVKYPNENW